MQKSFQNQDDVFNRLVASIFMVVQVVQVVQVLQVVRALDSKTYLLIFAQVSFSDTVRLKTGSDPEES